MIKVEDLLMYIDYLNSLKDDFEGDDLVNVVNIQEINLLGRIIKDLEKMILERSYDR